LEAPRFFDLGTAMRYIYQQEGVSFTFDSFRETTLHGVMADVEVEAVSPPRTAAGHIHGANLSLRSTSGKKSFEKALVEQDGFLDDSLWRHMVEQVTEMAWRRYRQGAPVIDLRLVNRQERPRWLYRPWLEYGSITDCFGDGGSMKSLLGTAVGVSVASGIPILGGEVAQPMPVYYLDWETDEYTRRGYMEAICMGHDIDIDTLPIYYSAQTTSLEATAGHVKRQIAELGIGLVIIDSRGYAASGDLEHSEGTLGLFRAIRSLKVATWVVDHVSKEGRGGDKPYGNIYAHNSARITWGATKISEEGELRSTLILRNHKMNNGVTVPRRAYQVTFANNDEDEPEQIGFELADMRDIPEAASQMPQKDQIAAVLKRASRPLSQSEIGAALIEAGTPIPVASLKAALNRYKNRTFVEAGGRWGVLINA
jgi:hypothetical protein